ncbi:MAG: tetratricopeptide repeat protein [Proteobacteria bacterium]|nr:tetratricopeptide repeat protein [Pseudomonadota bacterium]
MNADLLQGFYLGELLIEPLKGRVTDGANSRHLPPKAGEVLLCLARAPGQLVTREALLNEVWGSDHTSQEALGHAISELRHALDDHLDDPKFIQTLPKRGYRLVVAPAIAADHSPTLVLGADIGLFENLQRRGVLETTLAYVIVGWLLIQIADIVFPQLYLPAWAATFVTILVIAGFPIAIILSWFLEFRDGRAVLDVLSPAAARRRRFSRTYLSIIGALTVASLLVFVYDLNFGLPSSEIETGIITDPMIPENTIAVLPFFNNDGSDETQTFANGLVDDVTTRLSRVPGLMVSSRGDSYTLAPNSSSEQVRRRLRVAMYIEGSVEIANDKIRVIVQLINSANGFHILSRSFDRPRDDFFAIRDEITNLMVSSLRVTLPEDTQKMSAAASRYPDLDAYVLFRRGVDESRKPRTLSTAAAALAWFDAALEVDAEYAAAYAGKCDVLAGSFRLSDDPDSVRKAEAACGRALALNPNLGIVHAALGELYSSTGQYGESESAYIEALRINPKSVASLIGLADVYRMQQRPDEAEVLLRSAVGLQPGNWAPYSVLGFFMYRQGRFAEAAEQFGNVVALDNSNARGIANMAASYMMAGQFEAAAPAYQKAIDIEPQSVTYSNLGMMYYYLGQHDEAMAALRSAIELAPNAHLTWSNLGDVLYIAGKADEAQDAFARAEKLAKLTLQVNPNEPTVLMDIAWIHAMRGNMDEALEEIAKAVAASPDDPYAHYIEALIHNRHGDTGAALDALGVATAKGYSRTILAAEPHLFSLRGEPRFEKIIDAE